VLPGSTASSSRARGSLCRKPASVTRFARGSKRGSIILLLKDWHAERARRYFQSATPRNPSPARAQHYSRRHRVKDRARVLPCGGRWLSRRQLSSALAPYVRTVRHDRGRARLQRRSMEAGPRTSPGPARLRSGSDRNCRLVLWSQAHIRYQLDWHIKRLAEITSDQEQRCLTSFQQPGDLQIEPPQIKMAAVRRLVHRSRCQEGNRQPNAAKLSSTRRPGKSRRRRR
jgi:hypothetical protein